MRVGYRPLAFWVTSSSSLTRSAAFRATDKLIRRPITSLRMSPTDSPASPSPLRVALCQFHVTADKATNHQTCTDYIERAAEQGAKLVVLPEIWNSPYATNAFPEYAERLPDLLAAADVDKSLQTGNKSIQAGNDATASLQDSPSALLLQEQALKHKIWLVGDSVPEIAANGNYYNTCLVFSPRGQLVAKHRKVHLFDIDVPGKITFRESETLTGGDTVSTFSLDVGDCNAQSTMRVVEGNHG
jgi:omega-amidase